MVMGVSPVQQSLARLCIFEKCRLRQYGVRLGLAREPPASVGRVGVECSIV